MAESIDIPFRTNAAAVAREIEKATRSEDKAERQAKQLERANNRLAASEERISRAAGRRVSEEDKITRAQQRRIAASTQLARQSALSARVGASSVAGNRAAVGTEGASGRVRLQALLERVGSAGGVFSPLGQAAPAIGQGAAIGGRFGAALIGIGVAAAGAAIAIQGMQAAEAERIRVTQAQIEAAKQFTDALKGARNATIQGGAQSALALDPLRRRLAARTGDVGFAENFQTSGNFRAATAAGFSAQETFNAAINATINGRFNQKVFDTALRAARTGEVGLAQAAGDIAGNRRIVAGFSDPLGPTQTDIAAQYISSQGNLSQRDARMAVINAGLLRSTDTRLANRTQLAGRIAFAGAQTEIGGINVAEVGLRRQVFAAEQPLEAARLQVQQQLGDLLRTKAELAAQESRILEGLRDFMGIVGLGAGSQQTQFTRESDAIGAGAAQGGGVP